MTERRQVVFLGPSLPRDEARAILPDAVYLPPAAMGDVVGALRRYRPHAIGLIDGTFLQTMSVFHKELLYALDNGTWVLGASSLGALRAAECAKYGVIGVGQIYEGFASGALENDADVALTHADATAGFRPLSDALVTIRTVITAAAHEDLLDEEMARELIRRQEQRWFPERRLADSLADAAELGITGDQLSELRAFFRTRTRDLDPKRLDAISLLQAMGQLPDHEFPADARPHTARSAVFEALLERDVIVESSDGLPTSFDRIRRYAAVNEADFEDIMRTARQRKALERIGRLFGGSPNESELKSARRALCRQWGVTDDELESRASDLDLDTTQLEHTIAREALVRRVEQSDLGRTRFAVITQVFLDELRRRGRYDEVKTAAALQESLSRSVLLKGEIGPRQALRVHSFLSNWTLPEDLAEFVETHELGSIGELLQTIQTSLRSYVALFGPSLLQDLGDDIEFFDGGEPMMSRGD